MDSPLSVCTKDEQRSVIRFLWSEGVPGAEIHRRLSVQYGGNVLPRRSVYQWIEQFKSGRTSVEDEKRAGRPSTSTTDVNIEQARDLILNNRRMTINEVANHMQISHGSAFEIVHKRLHFHKVCGRWVPKQLSDEHKRNRVRICRDPLDGRANKEEKSIKNAENAERTRWKLEAKTAKHVAVLKPESLSDPESEEEEDADVVGAILPIVKEELPDLDGSMPAEIKQEYSVGNFLEIKEEPGNIKTESLNDDLWDDKQPAEAREATK